MGISICPPQGLHGEFTTSLFDASMTYQRAVREEREAARARTALDAAGAFVVDWELGAWGRDLPDARQERGAGVVADVVAVAPGIRKIRLSGELVDSGVDEVASEIVLDDRSSDVVLDIRQLTCCDGAAVALLSSVAGSLAGTGRLHVVFPPAPILRLIDESGLEQRLGNLKIVRHPAQPIPGPNAR